MSTSPLPPAAAAPLGGPAQLSGDDASTYASWFACLAEPVRVRLLHAVATATGPVSVGRLAELTGISQATCSHHLRKLADTGFVVLRREGTSTRVAVNAACCVGLPHAADAVMGMLASRPGRRDEVPDDVVVRVPEARDREAVRRLHDEGVASGHDTVEAVGPDARALDAMSSPDRLWVAELDGEVVGWTAITPVSTRAAYAGVGETCLRVGEGHRGRGVGRALLRRQVEVADVAGFWTLQTSIFPENRADIALHHATGYRTLGVRERIARHHGAWRDTVFLERRRDDGLPSAAVDART